MSSDPQLPAVADPGIPDSTGLRMLAVHAHPDDEASKGAAMMAAYVHAGARVMVATATDGAMGDLNNPHYGEAIRVERDIAAVRYQEMAEAARILDIEHRWLGFRDSGFPEGDDPMAHLEPGCFADIPLEDATAPLMRLIREFKPHVLVTYDEIGGYPHPDHLRTHAISMEAYAKSNDPDAYPGTGEPWEISKLYYDRAFNPDKYRAVHHALVDSGQESPYADRIAWYDRVAAGEDDPDAWRITQHEVTTQVNAAKFLEYRDAALRAHRSQVDTHGAFFFTPNEILRAHWPWEDYVLIDSKVPTSLPEDDLFAGLRNTPLD
ncbi:MAG TPA: mycothiol conjugate amidase Mca [Enteractinococcus sp.]